MEDVSNAGLGASVDCKNDSSHLTDQLNGNSEILDAEPKNEFRNSNETEHDEESVTDLQSVLNKISESLKTINQETMLPEEENDAIDTRKVLSDNSEENQSKQLDETSEKSDDNTTNVKNMVSQEELLLNSSEKPNTQLLDSSAHNSVINVEPSIEEVHNSDTLASITKIPEKFIQIMEIDETTKTLTIDNLNETKTDESIKVILNTKEVLDVIVTEKVTAGEEPSATEKSTHDENLTDIIEKTESSNLLNQNEDNSVKTKNPTEETVPIVSEKDEEKTEIPKISEQMDFLEDENDVVAIEEPTTIINLDDDENEEIEKMQTDEQEIVPGDQKITEEKSDDENVDDISKIENNKLASTNDETTVSVPVDKYVFHNKECINYECKSQNCNIYYQAPIFILNFYKITIKPNKIQYICENCYEESVNKYEEWCNIMVDEQPLLKSNITQKKNEFVEILDSSDEEDNPSSKLTSENGDFSENTVELLQNELDNIISDVFGRVKISNQLTWSKTILQHRLLKLQEDSDYITDTLMKLQKNADNMNNSLYQCPKIEMKVLAPLDLNSGKPYVLGEATQYNQHTIPPLGEICRPKIELNGLYFAAKNKVMASWLPCKAIEYVDPPSNSTNSIYYRIKFLKIKIPTLKIVPAKHMAYNDAPKVQLAIGTRVIALFDASTLSKSKDIEIKSAFYPGIIAEALQSYNNFRYLIFFDDGYTQYVHHRDVRLICEASLNVWEDIHPGSREFIQNYLINYKKNRPMVQVKKGQSMITELNGKWIYARVIDVDASLINMNFVEGPKDHTEWIYRGSTRLGPLFKATQKTNIPAVTRMPRRNEPYVRYMQDDDNALRRGTAMKSTAMQEPPPVRAVAKKTTSRQETYPMPTASSAAPVKHLNNSTIFVDDEEPKGKLVYYSAKIDSNPPPKPYNSHKCSPICITRKITIGHNYGILSKPLLNGWERAIYKIKGKKTAVIYTAPCGKRLRTMQEVHTYLRLTKNALNVENFVFDPECGCLTEYQVQRCIVNKSDITEGKEIMPIQCVNYYDHTMPPECIYSAVRLPTEGVHINTDEEFLVGCDCEDDCSDKSKCSCWQLTLEGAKYGNPHTPINNVGYHYKRLPDPVPTGIYECNSRCKCSKQCINRVVQHPLETKLQVFKTSNRGWGLRCINDVPKGSFICIYAGDLLTEQKANEGGANSGDEYFAELDYIEVAERLKDGYESDIPDDNDSDDDEDQYIPEKDSDEEFRPSKSVNRALAANTRNQIKKLRPESSDGSSGGNDEEDEQERQAINFEPNTSLAKADEENTTTKYQSMRKLFGKHEYCYIMDAKNIGNVGRYFNHSCSPNLFVQNVFVDTHDLRFPWVAFFALSQIRAGTELTWNYNYEVGVVPGKVLYCECGAPNCRGRLL